MIQPYNLFPLRRMPTLSSSASLSITILAASYTNDTCSTNSRCSITKLSIAMTPSLHVLRAMIELMKQYLKAKHVNRYLYGLLNINAYERESYAT